METGYGNMHIVELFIQHFQGIGAGNSKHHIYTLGNLQVKPIIKYRVINLKSKKLLYKFFLKRLLNQKKVELRSNHIKLCSFLLNTKADTNIINNAKPNITIVFK